MPEPSATASHSSSTERRRSRSADLGVYGGDLGATMTPWSDGTPAGTRGLAVFDSRFGRRDEVQGIYPSGRSVGRGRPAAMPRVDEPRSNAAGGPASELAVYLG
jgi:hypothetical protein